MGNKVLGKLEKVGLREFWESESTSFTPWLAQEANIALLGEAISLDLEVEAQEKEVGPFRADILCKDTANSNWVLIENQLERTDHLHLGQLLTYAAGLNAVTIVWISSTFTDEHRAALDWLNEITDERFNFFGLEIELWRIGNSPMAPKFNIICKPNDWARSIAGAAKKISDETLTETRLLQLEFWTGFKEYLINSGSSIRPQSPYSQNWMNHALGRSGIHLASIFSTWSSAKNSYAGGEVRAEVVLDDDNAKTYYEILVQQKPQIEDEFGEPLIWYNPEDKKVCRIYLQRDVDFQNKEEWPTYHAWLKDRLEALKTVFQQRAKMLDA